MSLCKYCGNDVTWVAKPNGGWFPPFDTPEELRNLDYEVNWSQETGDWVASPVDREMTAKLVPHGCVKLAEILETRRQRTLLGEEEPRTVVEYQYIEKFRNPEPEKYITIALRLKVKCPTCDAKPFEWCTYKNNPEQQTEQLHTSRRVA